MFAFFLEVTPENVKAAALLCFTKATCRPRLLWKSTSELTPSSRVWPRCIQSQTRILSLHILLIEMQKTHLFRQELPPFPGRGPIVELSQRCSIIWRVLCPGYLLFWFLTCFTWICIKQILSFFLSVLACFFFFYLFCPYILLLLNSFAIF